MRKLILLAAGLIALGVLAPSAATASPQPAGVAPLAGPSASQLLAKTQRCSQISNGKFKTDEETGRTVAVCDANGAVFWRADMDIDCDGQRTSKCNENTDCCFLPDTAFHQSDGKPLRADTLHYIVVPSPSSTWRYTSSGLRGAGSCAVIFNNKVLYAVIGDTGPTAIIGEASYATAVNLGINPDPSNGGTEGPVTYIVFPNTHVNPIETHNNATSLGEQVATQFAGGTTTPPTGGGGQITGIGGKCVDINAASNANGTAVQLYDCNGSTAQKWTVGTDGTVRALGKCLDVTSAGTTNGTPIQLWDCNGSNAQKWSANGSQNLVNAGSGKCLDAAGNTSANGTRLQIWTCGTGANQKWTLP